MTQVDAAVQEIFVTVQKRYGFVPNLIRELATSPAVARVYLAGQEAMGEATLRARDQQAVQLAISAYNGCHYCQAAHGMMACGAGIAPADADAIARGAHPADSRLHTLVAATRLILEKKGFLTAEEVASLDAQGLGRAQLYEVIALIGLKTISNYVNHIAHTEVDAAFRPAPTGRTA